MGIKTRSGCFTYEDFDWKNKDLRAFLRSQEGGLALLHQAAAKPGCHFHRRPVNSWFEWENWFFRQAADAHYAGKVLALDACVKAVDGDHQGALEDVKAILGMARHTSFFTTIGLERRGLDALGDVLHLSAPPAEQLLQLPLDGPYDLREFPHVEATFALLTLMGANTRTIRALVLGLVEGSIFPPPQGTTAPASLSVSLLVRGDGHAPVAGLSDAGRSSIHPSRIKGMPIHSEWTFGTELR